MPTSSELALWRRCWPHLTWRYFRMAKEPGEIGRVYREYIERVANG